MGSLSNFVQRLEACDQLMRISQPVSAELEITEIVDRISKGTEKYNKALLFEKVNGYDIPLLINMFGSAQRMAMALYVDQLDDLNTNLSRLIDLKIPDNSGAALRRGKELLKALRAAGLAPRMTKKASAQDVVVTDNPSLDILPILKCWPKDGGAFITLPQVVTRDPVKGTRNVGMYRLQKVDAQTLLVHWQRHKGGAEHQRVALEQAKPTIPAAVVLGGDPACIWSASAPLPPDIDEYLLAGWLQGQSVKFVRCITQPLEVPAQADIVLEGYIDPNQHMPEGPFGDHTGYYTPVEPFPVFHITAITHKKSPIYPATVVGIPPMEDYWMGKATERLFLPLVKLFIPEIVDYAMPAAGVFHNIVIVSIKKRFPGHARKVIHGIWGLALLSLAKAVVIVDAWVDVHNPTETLWQAMGNVDWSRDIVVHDGPVDHLDHASYHHSFGGKIGIDATEKRPEEGYERSWPEVVRMTGEVKTRIDSIWDTLLE
ncbi:MAG: menaquinone biosynthesis decarboxylase [Anaerolineae bacterium]|nr:menaquinone biosynthesis decarboxylase [Anaerolineae bacterium]